MQFASRGWSDRHGRNSAQPQYNVAAAGSLPVRIAAHQRRKMFSRFMLDTGVTAEERILDVGVTSDRSYEASNYLEAWYPYKDMVTAVGIDDASFLRDQYPGMRFVMADGLQLPFRDQAFDVVHSSAVCRVIGPAMRIRGRMLPCGASRSFYHDTQPVVSGGIPHRFAAGALAPPGGFPRPDAPHRP